MSDVIDLDRVALVLVEELAVLMREADMSPRPATFEVRSAFLARAATFLPEAFSDDVRERMENTLRDRESLPRYRSKWWHLLLDFNIALFALSHDYSWLSVPVANLNHHNSSLRFAVGCSVALVADRLWFDDEALLRCVEANIRWGYLYTEHCLALLVVSQGDEATKRAQLRKWLDANASNEIAAARDTLANLCAGSSVPNPFLGWFLWMNQYAAARLACRVDAPLRQIPLALPETEERAQSSSTKTGVDSPQMVLPGFSAADDSNQRHPNLTFDTVWQRISNLPSPGRILHWENPRE